MLGDIPFTAEYDAENRLTNISFSNQGRLEERFSDGFDHFLRRYERYVDDEQSVSKLFVRPGLLERQERNGQGEVTAQNVWRPDLVGSTLRSPNGISQEWQFDSKGDIARLIFKQSCCYLINHYLPAGGSNPPC